MITPGPWAISKIASVSDNNCAVYSESDGRDVALWVLPENAKLIAAAPEMYSILADCEKNMILITNADMVRLDRIRALIDQVTGEGHV